MALQPCLRISSPACVARCCADTTMACSAVTGLAFSSAARVSAGTCAKIAWSEVLSTVAAGAGTDGLPAVAVSAEGGVPPLQAARPKVASDAASAVASAVRYHPPWPRDGMDGCILSARGRDRLFSYMFTLQSKP